MYRRFEFKVPFSKLRKSAEERDSFMPINIVLIFRKTILYPKPGFKAFPIMERYGGYCLTEVDKEDIQRHPTKTREITIAISLDNDESEMVATIAHEATHAVDSIYRLHGRVRPYLSAYDNTEMPAYLTGWLVKTIYNTYITKIKNQMK